MHEQNKLECSAREALLKGKAQYGWPPWTNLIRSAAFYVENITCPFTKQATLIRRSTVMSLPLQLGLPGSPLVSIVSVT